MEEKTLEVSVAKFMELCRTDARMDALISYIFNIYKVSCMYTQSKSYMREKSCYCCYRLKKHRFAKEI